MVRSEPTNQAEVFYKIKFLRTVISTVIAGIRGVASPFLSIKPTDEVAIIRCLVSDKVSVEPS